MTAIKSIGWIAMVAIGLWLLDVPTSVTGWQMLRHIFGIGLVALGFARLP